MKTRYLNGVVCLLAAVLHVVKIRADHESSYGPTMQLSVQVTDTSGGTLHYSCRSTDGTIQDVNSANTSWTLPLGRGIHFAYVLVSNGLGGYAERRILLNTDTLSSPEQDPDEHSWTNHYQAPPAPA